VIELNPASEDLSDVVSHRIAPTLLLKVTDAMTVLQEEIFGPVLPIVIYETIEEAIAIINKRSHPLALYYFSHDAEEERKVLDRTTSGGVTINDCMTHAFDNSLPFGGIGPSGMGAYHGRQGFLTFSHARAIYRQSKSPQAELLFRPPLGNLKQSRQSHSVSPEWGFFGSTTMSPFRASTGDRLHSGGIPLHKLNSRTEHRMARVRLF
jgi:coniferyl-aldehyde dehydrogenase